MLCLLRTLSEEAYTYRISDGLALLGPLPILSYRIQFDILVPTKALARAIKMNQC